MRIRASLAAPLALAAAMLLTFATARPAGAADDDAGRDAKPDAKAYLKHDARPDEATTVPPPPAPGSAEDQTDRDIFSATRALRGTARWALAHRDADRRPDSVLRDFSCALGVRIDPSATPALATLFARSYADVEKAGKGVKALYHRARPLAGNDLPICEPRNAHLETSFSYPSGHATQGWVAALILADLAPDRAGPILDRGRVYGDSRVVCGSHWASDIAAARFAGTELFTALSHDPAFGADMARARGEVEAARASAVPPDPSDCAAVSAAVAHPYQP